jgi:hypothetical protein
VIAVVAIVILLVAEAACFYAATAYRPTEGDE